jgi:hypothetical protein
MIWERGAGVARPFLRETSWISRTVEGPRDQDLEDRQPEEWGGFVLFSWEAKLLRSFRTVSEVHVDARSPATSQNCAGAILETPPGEHASSQTRGYDP